MAAFLERSSAAHGSSRRARFVLRWIAFALFILTAISPELGPQGNQTGRGTRMNSNPSSHADACPADPVRAGGTLAERPERPLFPSRGAGQAGQVLELLFLASALAVPLAAVPWVRCATGRTTRARKGSAAASVAQLGLVVLRTLAPQHALVRASTIQSCRERPLKRLKRLKTQWTA